MPKGKSKKIKKRNIMDDYVGIKFSDDEALYKVCLYLEDEADKSKNPKNPEEFRDYHPAGNNILVIRKNVAPLVRKEFSSFIIGNDLRVRSAEELDEKETAYFIRDRYRSLYHVRKKTSE